jgi:hypothetical protein
MVDAISDEQLFMLISGVLGGVLIFALVIVWYFIRWNRRKGQVGSNPAQVPPEYGALARLQPEILDERGLAQVSLKKRPAPQTPKPTAPNARSAANKTEADPALDIAGRLGLGDTPAGSTVASSQLASAGSTPEPEALSSASDEPGEVLRLLRDPQTGQIVIASGRHKYWRLSDVSDKLVGRKILEVTAHLLHFTQGRLSTQHGIESIPTPAIKPLSQSFVVEPEPRQVGLLQAHHSLRRESAVPQTTAGAVPGPARSRGGFLARLGQKDETPSATPGLNLAAEINDIVQARLTQSSLSQQVTLQITAAPAGGIRIWVDGAIYQTPAEIPDLAVRGLIQTSIEEWEKS